MKMGKVNIPGMAPEQAAKINEMMAKRPPVTDQHGGREDRSEETGGRRFRGAVGFHQKRPAGTGRNDEAGCDGYDEDGASCGRTGSWRVARSALI